MEPTLTLEVTRSEATYLRDILSMWITGCEEELKLPTHDEHWATSGMREMVTSAMEIQMRVEVALADG